MINRGEGSPHSPLLHAGCLKWTILIYGIINSFALALMAIGFTLVYGISRLPNFAHGALYVVTGFLVWSLINLLKLHYAIAIPLALIIMGLVGAAIYRFVLIRVRGMATSEIIATYALGLAILEFLRWGGFKGMTYTLPVFIEGSIDIGGIPVDFQRIIVIGIGIVVVTFMWLFTHFNKIGLALRGMAQDEHAAMMLRDRFRLDGRHRHGHGIYSGRAVCHCLTSFRKYCCGSGLQCIDSLDRRLYCGRTRQLGRSNPCRFYDRISFKSLRLPILNPISRWSWHSWPLSSH